ncbi:MAG: AIPR family protein [Janthinobacterium lividum]
MTKYETLVNILDTIIKEAPAKMHKKYPMHPVSSEESNQARARAFVHLYLKVSFGILDFETREHFICDGAYDGGVDGYYINSDNKTVYYIQSKFRTTEKNFESKDISLEELISMDIDRISVGEELDENGNNYNGKIKTLQKEMSNTDGIGRYSHLVIILANLKNVTSAKLRILTGGFRSEVFDFEQCYDKLVFPVITGTFFNASDLNINIDLSNKNAGSKISYTVTTKRGECEITVLFVPAIELAKTMFKYKNSILKYNPRSYLGHEGKSVNSAIRETIIETTTNEFALFNNGITMLSDETNINERIGQKNKAQLSVKNPQIINGGQTSYTLSRIYEENLINDVNMVFQNKEVLLKIITLSDNNNHANKIALINEISEATNRQTPVINADRISNDDMHIKLQKVLFDKFGLLYERKRGEFSDGVLSNYILESDIIERNSLFRMFYAANGKISKAREKRLLIHSNLTFAQAETNYGIEKACFGFMCFKKFLPPSGIPRKNSTIVLAKVYAMTLLYRPQLFNEYQKAIDDNFDYFNSKWEYFLEKNKEEAQIIGHKFSKKNIPKEESRKNETVSYGSWFNSDRFKVAVLKFF